MGNNQSSSGNSDVENTIYASRQVELDVKSHIATTKMADENVIGQQWKYSLESTQFS